MELFYDLRPLDYSLSAKPGIDERAPRDTDQAGNGMTCAAVASNSFFIPTRQRFRAQLTRSEILGAGSEHLRPQRIFRLFPHCCETFCGIICPLVT